MLLYSYILLPLNYNRKFQFIITHNPFFTSNCPAAGVMKHVVTMETEDCFYHFLLVNITNFNNADIKAR